MVASPSPPWRANFASQGSAAAAFASVRATATLLTSGTSWPELDSLSALSAQRRLVNARGLPIRFVAQIRRCGQRDYESGILASGQVPSRAENWHDLLNALVWLALPHTKAALNQLQCTALATAQAGRRPALADAATLFDESGLLLVGSDATLFEALRQRRWRQALCDRRPDWAGVRAYSVGHAVLEKALTPYPGITAKCLAITVSSAKLERLPADGPVPAWLDARLAEIWRQGQVRQPGELFPLPILGIPGWWPDNQDTRFYDQTDIFRPPNTESLHRHP